MRLRVAIPAGCASVYPHVFDPRWDVPETIVRKEQPRSRWVCAKRARRGRKSDWL